MVGQRLDEFLRNRGLEAEDVPKVVGACVAAKYVTLIAGVAIGIRYQPLRQMVLARSLALRKVTVPSTGIRYQPVRQMVLTRSLALRKVAMPSAFPVWGHGSKAAMQARVGQFVEDAKRRASHTASANFSRLLTARRRWRGARSAGQARVGQVVEAARRKARMPVGKLFDADARLLNARHRWHGARSAGKALLQQKRLAKMRDVHEKAALARRTWHTWVSAKYWRLADRLESVLLRSRPALAFSARFGVQPSNLALGAAEGALISKIALPLTLPLTLLLALRALSRRRAPALADKQAI